MTVNVTARNVQDRLHQADPADRVTAATSLVLAAPSVTCDARLRAVRELKTVW